jgi:microcystin-dependent protein
MSDYTKIQNWASLVGTAIDGAPFDTEFAAVAAASTSKTNKAIPAATNNMASLSGAGDLQDSGILATNVADAVAYHYATGDIKISAIESEPTGWLYADGGSHSTSTYAALFSAIGYTYGGSGANFNVPDFRGRSPAGLDNLGGTSANVNATTAADSMGGEDGTQHHTLSTAEMPSHNHSGSADTEPNHKHYSGWTSVTRGGGGNNTYTVASHTSDAFDTSDAGSHSHTITVGYAGSSSSHENVSPTTFTNFLIKT